MDRQFKVSVVIPVYNAEEYIDETVRSVLKQTLGFRENIEIIFVNDGSPDHSADICIRYQEQYPANIKYIEQENSGVSAARNNGFRHATGKYVQFLDSDDKVSRNAYKAAVAFLEEHTDVDFCSLRIRHFDATNAFHALDAKFDAGTRVADLTEDPTAVQTTIGSNIFRCEAIRRYNVAFDSTVKYAEDMLFVHSLLAHNLKYGLISDAMFYYRKHKDMGSATQSSETKPEYYYTLRKVYVRLLQDVVARHGEVPAYYQYLFMYDLQWRIKTGIKAELPEEEKTDYWQAMRELLQVIDTKVIFEQRRMELQHKLQAFAMKYPEDWKSRIEVRDLYIYADGVQVAERKEIRNYITELEMVAANQLQIIGNIWFWRPCKLFYRQNGEFTEVPLVWEKEKLWGEGIVPHARYNETLELDSAGNIDFWIEYQGEKFQITNYMHNFSRLTNIPGSHFADHGYYFEPTGDSRTITYTKNKSTYKRAKNTLSFYGYLLKRRAKRVFTLRIIYAVCKVFLPRKVWLFCDREFMAEDSGEELFKRFPEAGLSGTAYFVVSKNCADYKRMQQYGKVVAYESLKYKLLFLRASYVISSHADVYINNPFGHSRWFYEDLIKSKYIYLTHGVLLHDSSSWLNKYNKNFTLNVVSSPLEYESLLNDAYMFRNGELIRTGMPRYDAFLKMDVNEEKKITFMPSWRSKLAGQVIPGTQRRQYNPAFTKSEYYLFYKELLTDPALTDALREKGYTIKFCIHPSFRAQLKDFHDTDVVKFAIDVNVAYEARSSKCLITDYSSAACDFAYLGKPVIYANFDMDHIYDVHYYNKGYFDYDVHGFGPNCKTKEEVIGYILRLLDNGFQPEEEYARRMEAFFYYRDANNADRVYEEIRKLDHRLHG